jgi:hypothetical protein
MWNVTDGESCGIIFDWLAVYNLGSNSGGELS